MPLPVDFFLDVHEPQKCFLTAVPPLSDCNGRLRVFSANQLGGGFQRRGSFVSAVLFSEPFRQELVADRVGERDVDDPAKMDAPDFRTAEAKFPASEAMQMDGYVRPLRDFAFEL